MKASISLAGEVCNRVKIQHEYADKKLYWNDMVDNGSSWDNVKFDNIDLCKQWAGVCLNLDGGQFKVGSKHNRFDNIN